MRIRVIILLPWGVAGPTYDVRDAAAAAAACAAVCCLLCTAGSMPDTSVQRIVASCEEGTVCCSFVVCIQQYSRTSSQLIVRGFGQEGILSAAVCLLYIHYMLSLIHI